MMIKKSEGSRVLVIAYDIPGNGMRVTAPRPYEGLRLAAPGPCRVVESYWYNLTLKPRSLEVSGELFVLSSYGQGRGNVCSPYMTGEHDMRHTNCAV